MGLISLLRPLSVSLPFAVAKISTLPKNDMIADMIKNVIIQYVISLGYIDTGVSINSKCAGKKALSSFVLSGVSVLCRIFHVSWKMFLYRESKLKNPAIQNFILFL